MKSLRNTAAETWTVRRENWQSKSPHLQRFCHCDRSPSCCFVGRDSATKNPTRPGVEEYAPCKIIILHQLNNIRWQSSG